MSRPTRTFEIRPASDAEVYAFLGSPAWADRVEYAEVLVENGMILGMGSMAQHLGRRFVFLDLAAGAGRHSIAIVRALRRWFAAQEGRIYVVCNRDHDTAPGLLTRLGFEPTGLMIHGREVWGWNSQH